MGFVFLGLQGDWETRRLFAGFNVNLIESGNRDYFDQSYQVGIAPYLGEFGDLHTWIMVKTKRNSVADEWSTFPQVRLFKGGRYVGGGLQRGNELGCSFNVQILKKD